MDSAPVPASLSAKKVGLIQVARRQLHLSDDDYRAILLGRGGCESAAELDELGFLNVMKHMNALGFRSTWTKRNFGHRAGMASPAQVELMRQLWLEYHGPDDGEAALNGWLNKFHKVSALRFVSASKATAILNALKRMRARKSDSEGTSRV